MLHWLLHSPCSWLSSTDIGHFRLSFHRPNLNSPGAPLRRPSPFPSHFPSSCFHSFPFISISLLCLFLLILLSFLLCFRRPILTFSFSFPFSFRLFPSRLPLFLSSFHSALTFLIFIAHCSPFLFKSPLPAVLLLIHFNLRSFPLHSIHSTPLQHPTLTAVRTTRRPSRHSTQNSSYSSLSTMSSHALYQHDTAPPHFATTMLCQHGSTCDTKTLPVKPGHFLSSCHHDSCFAIQRPTASL